jgi:anti-sigma factor (TIGR02949 family)
VSIEPIDCAECQENVHEYLQREVSEDLGDAITAHVANCDHCDEIYQQEDTLNEVLRSSLPKETPQQIVERIRAHIAELG